MIGIISIALLVMVLEFRINLTDSIPVGLYRITSMENLKNSFVIFCPDERPAFKQALDRGYISSGLCPGGYGYLMKKVVATKGDMVSVTAKGVYVNKTLIPFSKPKLNDENNNTLPQWRVFSYQLEKDEFLTMTNQSEWSFDSRYYGIVHKEQIKGIMKPMWTKGN